MAKRFKIASNPTFKSKVSVPRVGGEDIQVEFEFKTLSRTKLAQVFDKWQEQTKQLTQEDMDTLSALTEADIEIQVEQIKDVVVGWEFEDEFNDDSIRELVETSSSAANAILEVYQEAYSKKRLGNSEK